MLAVSTDDAETLRKFKAELKAPFAFVSDEKGELSRKYDVKTPVVTYAKRYTFVIGEGRKILEVSSGGDAIDPDAAIVACPLRKPGGAGPGTPDAGTK